MPIYGVQLDTALLLQAIISVMIYIPNYVTLIRNVASCKRQSFGSTLWTV